MAKASKKPTAKPTAKQQQLQRQPRDDAHATTLRFQQKLGAFLSNTGRQDMIRAVLPGGMDADRMLNIAVASALENPALAVCDTYSVLESIIQAARMGLEVGGLAGEAYLIPYQDRKNNVTVCTFQAGYRGWLKIARSEQVRQIHGGVVYEKDPVWRFVECPLRVEHEPLIAPDEDRGKLVCSYAVAFDHNGGIFDATWVSAKELKSIQTNTPAWRQYFNEMAKKTAVKRLAKNLPLMHQHASRLSMMEATEYNDGDPRGYVDAALHRLRMDLQTEDAKQLPAPGRGRPGVSAVVGGMGVQDITMTGSTPAPPRRQQGDDGDPGPQEPEQTAQQATEPSGEDVSSQAGHDFGPPAMESEQVERVKESLKEDGND